MKSFKEYILSEDIINWYLKEFCKGEYSKNKNGNFSKSNKALSDENIELAKSTFRDDNKGRMSNEDIEAQLAMLTRKAIKDKIDDVNRIKNANRKFEKGSLANDIAKKQYGSALSKIDYIEANEKDKITVNVKNAFKDLKKSIEELKAMPAAASVVTEAEGAAAQQISDDDSEKVDELSAKLNDAIKKAEIADEALKTAGVNIGEDYRNGTKGQRLNISEKFVTFITELCKGTDFISNDGGGAIISKIKQAARDNKLSMLETQDVLSTAEKLKEKPTNLKFIIALLWFKTVAPELYKDALMTEGGNTKSNANIPQSVKEQYEKMVKGLGNLILDKDFLKVLGNEFENFAVEPFKAKVNKVYEKLWKNLTPKEAEEVKKLQAADLSASPASNTETNTNTETTSNSNTETASNSNTETASNSETNSNTEIGSKANTETASNSETNSKGLLINKLTFNSSNEEVDKAVAEVFGIETPSNNEEYGVIYNRILSYIEEVKNDNDELYKSSLHKDEIKEDIFTQAYDELLKEGIIKQKIINSLPKFGRMNLDKDRESVKGSWNKCIDSLKSLRLAYLKKAKVITNNFSNKINSISNKKNLIYNLKNLFSDFNETMYDTYAGFAKKNSYSEAGKIMHDVRNDFHSVKSKFKELKNNSKGGQVSQIIDAEIEKKIKALDIETLEKIPENYRDEFAYAVLSKDTKAALYEKIAGGNKSRVIDALKNALNSSDDFIAGNETEIEAFVNKLATSLKDKPEIKDWLMKYYQQYNMNKNIEPLRNFIIDASKLLPAIKQKLRGKEDVETALLEAHKSFKDWLILKEGAMDAASERAMNRNPNQAPTEAPRFSDKEKIAIAIAVITAAIATGNKNAIELKEKAINKILKITSKDEQVKMNLTAKSIEDGIKSYVEKRRGEIVPAMTTFNDKLNASVANNQAPVSTPAQQAAQQSQQMNQVASAIPAAKPQINETDPNTTNVNTNQATQATVTTSAVGDYKIPDKLTKKLIRRKINSFMF